MSNIIDTIARELYDIEMMDLEFGDELSTFEACADVFRADAKRVIAKFLDAMETPSEGMREAGGRQDHLTIYGDDADSFAWGEMDEDSRACSRSDAAAIWSAMLAAFRKEITNGD